MAPGCQRVVLVGRLASHHPQHHRVLARHIDKRLRDGRVFRQLAVEPPIVVLSADAGKVDVIERRRIFALQGIVDRNLIGRCFDDGDVALDDAGPAFGGVLLVGDVAQQCAGDGMDTPQRRIGQDLFGCLARLARLAGIGQQVGNVVAGSGAMRRIGFADLPEQRQGALRVAVEGDRGLLISPVHLLQVDEGWFNVEWRWQRNIVVAVARAGMHDHFLRQQPLLNVRMFAAKRAHALLEH